MIGTAGQDPLHACAAWALPVLLTEVQAYRDLCRSLECVPVTDEDRQWAQHGLCVLLEELERRRQQGDEEKEEKKP